MRPSQSLTHRPRQHKQGRWLTLLFLLGALIVGSVSASFASGSEAVVVLEVTGVIDPIVARYVERSIYSAAEARCQLVVIQLDTPGGLDTAMRDITQAILNADVPVADFVSPQGARAASAGVFITMAAHVAAMAPGTNIGAATPVDISGAEMTETMKNKVTNDAVAYIQAIAQQRGRNAEWAEEAVRGGASLAAQQAFDENVVDFMAQDLDDLLAQLNGYKIAFSGGEVTLHLETATVEMAPMTLLEKIAHALIDPNIAYLLLSLGSLALLSEIYHPGAILPGMTGVICLILAFVAFGSLPVNWGGIALIILAFGLFILDTKIAGFLLSVGGVISFVLGSLLLFSPFTPPSPVMPQVRVNPALLAAMTVLLSGFFFFAVAASLRVQRAVTLMGNHVLVGQTGIVLTGLDPQGVIQVQSETWTAAADGGDTIAAGETVEVVGKDGLRLQVRRTTPKQE